jgi:hypothetical protein
MEIKSESDLPFQIKIILKKFILKSSNTNFNAKVDSNAW